MSLLEYFESKGQLEEVVQIAATSQNFSEKQIEDEIAGASTQGQNSNSTNWRVDISISNKKKDEKLSTIYKYPFSHENQQFSAD